MINQVVLMGTLKKVWESADKHLLKVEVNDQSITVKLWERIYGVLATKEKGTLIAVKGRLENSEVVAERISIVTENN